MKEYWDRNVDGSVKCRKYAGAQVIAAVGATGAGMGLLVFYAQDDAQAEKVTAEGYDAAEKLPLYLSAERARALAAGILKAVEDAEAQLKAKN